MKELTHRLFIRLYHFITEGDLSISAIIAFAASTVTIAVIGIAIKRIFRIND